MHKNFDIKKQIKPWLAHIFSCLFFILSTILLTILAKQDGKNSILYHFATVSRFMYLILIIITAAKISKYLIDIKENNTTTLQNTMQNDDIEDIIEDNDKSDSISTINEQSEKDITQSDTQTITNQENYNKNKWVKIPKKSKNTNIKPTESNLAFALRLVFLVLLFTNIIVFILVISINYSFLTQPTRANTSMISIIFLIMMLLGAFILRKWLLLKNNDKEINLFTSFLLIFEILLLVTLFFYSLLAVLKLNYVYLLSWVYWAAFAYILVSLVIAILKAVLKKEVLENFNYNIIPRIVRKKEDTILQTIEKNTGLSFKSMWSLKYLVSILPSIVLSILLLFFASTSLYKVESYENAIVYRFGSIQQNISQPGLHLKFPFPIDTIEIYDVDRVQKKQIGYIADQDSDFLWTKEHDGGEHTLLLGNGNELVSINIKLIFNIENLYDYVKYYSQPENVLSAKAYEVIMEKTISTNLDTILCVDRSELSNNVKTELNDYSKATKLGLKVTEVIVESIHPPVEIASVYQNVISANIDKKTKTINAEADATNKLTAADKEKNVDILETQADQTNRVAQANYEMAVYYAAFEAYQLSPQSFTLSKYLSTYEKVIQGSKIYVFSPNIDVDLSNYIINHNQDGTIRAITGNK